MLIYLNAIVNLNIKFFVISAVLLFVGLNSHAQTSSAKFYKVKSNLLTNILCRIDTTIQIVNKELVVRYILVDNEYGSANQPGDDEISQQILVAVSTFDDAPYIKLYSTSRLLMPKLISFKSQSNNSITLIYEHGYFRDKKRKTIIITPTKKGYFTVYQK